MKPAEKDAEMQRFKRNETQIMVATTVIEVGVDVPNASIMVIENANRFGLSQLHQLRGRVGRGADQSFCLLVTPYQLSEDTRKRIEIMTVTCDGFEIAEADLKLRGPGDLEGTQQSGIAFELRLANLARDGALIERCRELARDIITADPELCSAENNLMAKVLRRLRVELYTEPYALHYVKLSPEMAVKPFVEAARVAQECGMGLNAGHDLSLQNLKFLKQQIPWIDEVSIGHALVCDALYLGLEKTILEYKKCII